MTAMRPTANHSALILVLASAGLGGAAVAAPPPAAVAGARESPAPEPSAAPAAPAEPGAAQGAPAGSRSAAATFSQAGAPPAPTSREARRRAAAALKRGMQLIASKQYDAAIESVTLAFELDPRAEHLYNLGVAHHLKGDRLAALAWYQRFLSSGSRNRKLVAAAEEYTAQLTTELRAEAAAEAKRDADERAQRRAREAELERQRAAAAEAARQARLAAAQRAERDRLARERDGWRAAANAGRGKRLMGASLLIAGGASLGVAAVAAFEARSASNELDALGEGDTWTVSRDWLHQRGESAETRAIAFSIAGACLAAGGGVLYFLGERDARRAPRERLPVVTPLAGPGAAGVTLAGSF